MMTKTSYSLACLVLALSTTLPACSHSNAVEEALRGNGNAHGKFSDPRATVAGVDIKGHWVSDCHADDVGTGFRNFDLTYDAAGFTRKVTHFSDSKCATATKTDESHGEYRFVEKYASDIYVVEYVFEWNQGITTMGLENIRLNGGNLYIGNMASGEPLGVLENEPLHPLGVNPTPNPSTPVHEAPSTKADVVKTYAEARYAVCVIQGQAWVMDFNGADLSSVSSGTMRVGRRNCDITSVDVKWYTDIINYNASTASGTLQIEIVGLKDSYIHTDSQGTGLAPQGYPRGAYSLLMGNSGNCYFTKNTGFDGIPESCN